MAAHPMTSLSVIIPTKNRPLDLESALESLFRQSVLPRQLILIDQSFNNESRLRIETLCSQLGKTVELDYIWDTSIPGGAAARNRAMEMAEGDIWLFLDDDVYLEPDFVEQLTAVYFRYPQVSGVSGIVTNYLRPSWVFRCWNRIFVRGPFQDERQAIYWNADRLRHAEPIPVTKLGGGLMSFRAEAIRGLQFDGSLRGVSDGEDVDFCVGLRPGAILVIAPGARLVHKQSPLGRSQDHWLRRDARVAHYLYQKHWKWNLRNRLCFVWLNIGYAVAATLASLRRGSLGPWRVLGEAAQAHSHPGVSNGEARTEETT